MEEGCFQEHEQLNSCHTTGKKVVSFFQQEFVVCKSLGKDEASGSEG